MLDRDDWRCQVCGVMGRLEFHHQRFRSRSGDDEEPNLITGERKAVADGPTGNAEKRLFVKLVIALPLPLAALQESS